jgi:hypothetical protein
MSIVADGLLLLLLELLFLLDQVCSSSTGNGMVG